MRSLSPLIFLPAFVVLCTQAIHGQSYMITDLGTPGGAGSYSESHGINQAGSVVGDWGGAFTQDAFLYRNGTTTTIAPSGIAYAVNNSGAVVGQAGVAQIHAFLYTNGMMTDLGAYGGTYSIAWALNNAGEIVGESTVSSLPNAQDHAIWWQSGGGKLDLGVLPSGDYSSARGINDSNVIVGESSSISGTVTNIYAFIYSNGVMNAVGTLPGGNYSSARAINYSGQIVGEGSVTNGDTHAFLFSGGGMLDLGTFGGNLSSASAINNLGQVVGYSTTADNQQRAFLFNGSTMLDVNSLFSQPSVCTNLISGDGINDAGEITGSGYTPTGDYHAFLLTPVALVLSHPVVLANGQFSVTVNGVPGQRFALEISTNLTSWISVHTNTLSSSSLVCTNTSAANYSLQFYRAMLLP